MITLRTAAPWAGAIFLAVIFVVAGLSKLEGAAAMRWAGRFAAWGYPANAHYVVGLFEIVGGLAVLVPRLRGAASLILAALMAGALCTHVMHAEFPRVLPPLVLGGLACLTYWSHRRSTRRALAERGEDAAL
jgi:putative oxidoreductase